MGEQSSQGKMPGGFGHAKAQKNPPRLTPCRDPLQHFPKIGHRRPAPQQQGPQAFTGVHSLVQPMLEQGQSLGGDQGQMVQVTGEGGVFGLWGGFVG